MTFGSLFASVRIQYHVGNSKLTPTCLRKTTFNDFCKRLQ
jgi:hypothetical protein